MIHARALRVTRLSESGEMEFVLGDWHEGFTIEFEVDHVDPEVLAILTGQEAVYE